MENSARRTDSQEAMLQEVEHEHHHSEEPYVFQAHAFPVLLLLLFTAWIHLPSLSVGLPYFYHEDEAHHFNRTVRMVQSGDFNPHYFHKPSLHFYLRMPVVMASFLWNVKEGNIRTIEEIQTRDKLGVGEYAFTASHPGIVKWNRAFGLLLLMSSTIFIYSIVQLLGASRSSGLFAGLLFAFSPTTLEHGVVIGVDIVVTFFALLTTVISIKALREERARSLLTFISGLCAGLTISSKYNALPIICVPLIASLLMSKKLRQQIPIQFLLCLLAAIFGFLLGSPFILVELPLFLNQLAYEIWHYGIAGHIGNEATPGLAQATHYLTWLFSNGMGAIGGIMALLGICLPILSRKIGVHDRLQALLPLTFLALYMGLMIAQKANFERNMLIALPFFCIFAGLFAEWLLYLRIRYRGALRGVLCGGALLLTIFQTISLREARATMPESRNALLTRDISSSLQTVCAAELWLSSTQAKQIGCREAQIEKTNALQLFQDDVEQIILPEYAAASLLTSGLYTKTDTIAGVTERQRVVQNPAITLLSQNYSEEIPVKILKELVQNQSVKKLNQRTQTSTQARCEVGSMRNDGESGCWITERVTPIFVAGSGATSFSVSTPWDPQSMRIYDEKWHEIFSAQIVRDTDVEISLKANTHYTIMISNVRQPSRISGSQDTRLLGVLIR